MNAFKVSYNAFGDGYFGLCDFNSLMEKFNTLYGYDTSSVTSAVNDLVFYKNNCSNYSITPCGLNAFVPELATKDKKVQLQVSESDYSDTVYAKASKLDAWQDLCLEYGNFVW